MNIQNRLRPVLRDQRGVTLVELLITMGLLSIFLVILTTIFTASVDVQSQTGSYSAVTTDGRFGLSRLEYDIRRASAITTPTSLGDTDSSLVLTIGGDTYTYSVAGGRLQLDINGTADYLTGEQSTISGLSFQKLGTSGGTESIRYSFTVSSDSAHHTDTLTYTSTTERRP